MLSKDDIKASEEEFQALQKQWKEFNDLSAYKKMWPLVLACCTNITKKNLKGVRVTDLDGLCLDACIIVMDRIQRGVLNIDKLSSYCYWPVKEVLYDKERQNNDRLLSYDKYLEDTRNQEGH